MPKQGKLTMYGFQSKITEQEKKHKNMIHNRRKKLIDLSQLRKDSNDKIIPYSQEVRGKIKHVT